MTLVGAALLVALAWAGVRIVDKTGLNRWLGLLLAVPLFNVGLLLWLALADWPVHAGGHLHVDDSDDAAEPPQLPPPDDSGQDR